MNGLTRGSAAIIGAAESDIGAVAALMSPIDLMAQGIQRALADAGLSLSDVDGVFCATSQARTSVMSLVEYLGLPDAYTDSTIVGGSSFEIHVAHAQAALAAGLCSVAVIAYGSTQRTVGRRGASPREYNPYETPFRPFLPATAYAMAANRHMHEFGTTREQTRRGRGRGARMGAAQSGGVGEEAAVHRRCAERAADQRSVDGARYVAWSPMAAARSSWLRRIARGRWARRRFTCWAAGSRSRMRRSPRCRI